MAADLIRSQHAHIEAVVFDLNGVIHTDLSEGLARAARTFGFTLGPQDVRRLGASLYVEASLGRVEPDEFWQRLRQCLAPGSLPTGREEGEFLSFIGPREPHLERTLGTLKARFALGVLSNHVGRWARALLERFGLLHLFDAVLISSDVGLRKPNLWLCQRVCDLLGVPPAEAIYVADEEEDLLAAQAVGMLPVFIPGEDRQSAVGVEIDRVSDLLKLLEQVRGRGPAC